MDTVHFNKIVDKVGESLAAKRLNRWETPYIKHGDVNITRIRQRFGMSQAEFASILGVGEETVVNWERGVAKPGRTYSLLFRIMEKRPEALLEALWDY